MTIVFMTNAFMANVLWQMKRAKGIRRELEK